MFCTRGNVLRNNGRDLHFQLKTKLIGEVRFCFEAGEAGSIRNASLFRDACRRRAQDLRNYTTRRRFENRTSLFVAPRPRQELILKLNGQTVSYRCSSNAR
jgi:hypothetical protein